MPRQLVYLIVKWLFSNFLTRLDRDNKSLFECTLTEYHPTDEPTVFPIDQIIGKCHLKQMIKVENSMTCPESDVSLLCRLFCQKTAEMVERNIFRFLRDKIGDKNELQRNLVFIALLFMILAYVASYFTGSIQLIIYSFMVSEL